MIVSEYYRVNFKLGSKLNKAAMIFTERQLGVKHEQGIT